MAKERGESLFWWGLAVGCIGGAITAAVVHYVTKPKEKRGKSNFRPLQQIREIIDNYQTDSTIREVAAKITQNCRSSDSICEIASIFNFVANKIKYMSDPKRRDYFSSPIETLKLRIGDCDCKSILLATLLESIGHETQVVIIPGHAFVQVSINEEDKDKLPQSAYYIPGEDKIWVPLESTAEGAHIGWMSEASYNAYETGNLELG